MIAVIFEVQPKPEYKNNYFTIADKLKALLSDVPGFISIERFQSLTNKQKLLSLSFWENAESVNVWRNQLCHRDAQSKGREVFFEHYRLRVTEVIRDYSMTDRGQVPENGMEKNK